MRPDGKRRRRRQADNGVNSASYAAPDAQEGTELTPNRLSIGLIQKSQSKVSHESVARAQRVISAV